MEGVNQSCSPSKISGSKLNGAIVPVKVHNYVLIEKIEILVVKNIFLLNFAKYLSFSEVQNKSHVVIFRTDFSKLGVYSKSVTKWLYGRFLVSEGIFNLVCYCEKCWWSDISCA